MQILKKEKVLFLKQKTNTQKFHLQICKASTIGYSFWTMWIYLLKV